MTSQQTIEQQAEIRFLDDAEVDSVAGGYMPTSMCRGCPTVRSAGAARCGCCAIAARSSPSRSVSFGGCQVHKRERRAGCPMKGLVAASRKCKAYDRERRAGAPMKGLAGSLPQSLAYAARGGRVLR